MVTKRVRWSTALASLLFLGIGADGAVGAETPSLQSPAAMLTLHMPFGGRSVTVSQTSLTMNFGYHWRLSPGALGPLERGFTPTLQAGWMVFSGRPVFRVGAFNALRLFSDPYYESLPSQLY